jgi:ABC-2 type transport system permease protein
MTDRARAAVVIPYDFADRLEVGEPTAVQVLIDGSDSNTATIAQGYALAIVNGFDARRRAGPDAHPLIEVQSRVWYNPELKSVNFIVPGVIAVIMMIVGAIVTALSIVKEKERGTLEQILRVADPPGRDDHRQDRAVRDHSLHRLEHHRRRRVPGLPRPDEGQPAAVRAVLDALSRLRPRVGVFVSTIADTMQNAMLFAIFLSLMPSILLSGFVFPIEYMPLPIQAISYLFPGRYFVTAIRGIYLKGVGLAVLWPEAVFLSLFAIGIVWLSTSRFRDRLE